MAAAVIARRTTAVIAHGDVIVTNLAVVNALACKALGPAWLQGKAWAAGQPCLLWLQAGWSSKGQGCGQTWHG